MQELECFMHYYVRLRQMNLPAWILTESLYNKNSVFTWEKRPAL